MRIAHVITGLGRGGAELALARLVEASDPARIQHAVVSLTGPGPVGERLRAAGAEVRDVHAGGLRGPLAVRALRRVLRELRPDVVQTWMYHADLLGGLAARTAGLAPLLWNLRMTEPSNERLRTRAVVWTGARLSRRWPDAIVCCAEATRDAHARLGYDAARMRVIHNGYALPAGPADRSLRASLGWTADEVVIGRIGRWHPMKDYGSFVRAAGIVAAAMPAARFLLAGTGVDNANAALRAAVEDAGVTDRAVLLGPCDDMGLVYGALDVLCSSSAFGEGFPNVIAEAMACGVPVVATDVGESAHIVGDTGLIVEPGRPDLLADALESIAAGGAEPLTQLGARARQRIAGRFSSQAMAQRYEALYRELADVRH